jgi:hypothetical protein
MLGLLPRLLHEFVESRGDAGAVAEVNELAGLPRDRKYRIDAGYDEVDFHRLLRAATRVLDSAPEAVTDEFAVYVFEDFCRRWPAVYEMFNGARDLLEMLPNVYRAIAAVLLDEEGGEPPPVLLCERRDRETVVYCGSGGAPQRFLSSFVETVIRHYGDTASIERLPGSDRVGAGRALVVSWEGAA